VRNRNEGMLVADACEHAELTACESRPRRGMPTLPGRCDRTVL
jgi:hypothetical protein